MLREKDVFDIEEVKVAIIESNGKLTVQIKNDNSTFFYPVIIDGKLDINVLESIGVTKKWLLKEVHKLRIKNFNDIFYAGISNEKEIRISIKNTKQQEQYTNVEH